MTADEHIAGIQSAMGELEQAQKAERKAAKKSRQMAALLHARLAAAAVAYRDTHGHDSAVMVAAVAPKTPPQED